MLGYIKRDFLSALLYEGTEVVTNVDSAKDSSPWIQQNPEMKLYEEYHNVDILQSFLFQKI